MASTPLTDTRRGRREASAFTDAVITHVAGRLEQLMDEAAAAGVEPDSLGSPAELAERMIATIPQPSPWAKLVGPVYTTQGLRALLGGVSRQAIDDRIARGTLLCLTTADNRRVFPVFQFDAHNQQLAGLSEMLAQLRPVADEWTIASWLTHPQASLERKSPIVWLREGLDRAPLDALVRRTAARWAQ
jgi:hypothetical protein